MGTRSEDAGSRQQGRGGQRGESVRRGVQVYADGSGIGGSIGAAVCCSEMGGEACTEEVLREGGQAHGLQGRGDGAGIGSRVGQAETHMDAAEIGTDSQAALRATRNMRGAPGQHLLDKYQERLEAVQHRHGVDTVEIRWIPGHDSIAGNERADTEAKRLLTVTQAQPGSSPNVQRPGPSQQIS